MWTSVLLRPVRPGQRSLHVRSVSPCPSCSCLSWQVLGTLPCGCAIPRSCTRSERPPVDFRCTPSGSCSAQPSVSVLGWRSPDRSPSRLARWRSGRFRPTDRGHPDAHGQADPTSARAATDRQSSAARVAGSGTDVADADRRRVSSVGGLVWILRRRYAGDRQEMPDTPGAHEVGTVQIQPDGRLTHV